MIPCRILGPTLLVALGACADSQSAAGARGKDRVAPVEVAAIERGAIALRRTFSGTSEAAAAFTVAPKIPGRLARVRVDLGSVVKRGQVVAELDEDVFAQAVNEAAAELAVARANRTEASSAAAVARRELERARTLREQGVISASAFDVAEAEDGAKAARVAVAAAEGERATAALQAARIRLGHTRITAQWEGGAEERMVAARYVDGGDVVSAGTPVLRIVELDPIIGVISVTEKDYGYLEPGQGVSVTTAAHPGASFPGTIARIAPVFAPGSRQARVELTIANADRRLKPGMFISAAVILRVVDDAVVVPEAALASRDDRTGVFVVDAPGERVRWRTVEVGIREGDRVQVTGEGLTGRVVTLGHQLVDDGSRVTIPEPAAGPVQAGEPPAAQ